MNVTAATPSETHQAALEAALAAKRSREESLRKVSESKDDVSPNDSDVAQMDVLRQALGSCANRARLFSTPVYCINEAFSVNSFPDDAEWVERGGLTSLDKVLDIGCGDGRAILRAAELGASAVGYEINEERAKEAVTNIAACSADVQARVIVHVLNCVEVIDTQLADGVTFVFLYLTPRGLKKCLKYFRANKRVLRVVSYINPFRELSKDGGGAVPCRKIWCDSSNPKEREMGVKFPIFCYKFGGEKEEEEDEKEEAEAALPKKESEEVS
jgi:SAM-dependent methyltransferase